MTQPNNGNGRRHSRLSQGDFILTAVNALRGQNGKLRGTKGNGKGRGIHSVNSGAQGAFERYFGKPFEPALDRAVKAGVVETRSTKRGVMIYLTGEAPRPTGEARVAIALKTMGLRVKVKAS